MKRNFMKKAVAVSLSAAMAFSLSAANALTASAAATVSMPKTAKVTVGKSKTLKVKTNKKWKVTKVGVKQSKKYVTVKRISNTKVRITGKKATSKAVTVRVRVKKKTGNKAEKVLKCKVTVKKKAPTPDVTPTPTPTPDVTPTPTPVVKDSVTVKTQADLDAALADSNITKITIGELTADTTFEIKGGTHDKVDLTVDSVYASVVNSATFKSITINAIADHTWTEKGQKNKFTVTAPSARFVFDKEAIIERITLAGKTALTILGQAKDPVPVDVTAAGSIVSEAPILITASAEVSITLEASAKGSTVKVVRGKAKFGISLLNKTDDEIVVRDDKDVIVVKAPAKSDKPYTGTTQVADTTTPTPTPTPTPGASTSTKKDLTDAYLDLAIPDVTGVTTGSAIKFTLGEAKVYTTTGGSVEVSGVDIGYSVVVKRSYKVYDKDGHVVREIDRQQIGSKSIGSDKKVEFDKLDWKDTTQYVLEIKAFVKENDTYKQRGLVTVGEIVLSNNNGTITSNTFNYGRTKL